MYAVVRTGSKQYRVEPGKEFLVEKLHGVESGHNVELGDVLLYADGDRLEIGRPVIAMAVHCRCLSVESGPKLRTIKYKRRHNYKRTYGHRQTYTRLLVESIGPKN